ncbi:MAG: serine/threonine-protein kinase, partial [Pseudomonadota bacterium]
MNDTIHQHLSVGFTVDHFDICEVLGSGGFGITYKAWDTRLERDVALKEFLPTDLAIREGTTHTIKARTGRVEDYRFALDKFLQEARTLAKFSHPNIVRVTQFLEANGTAYLVMDYERGRSLSDYLKSHPGPVPQETLKAWFIPILKGLVEVHKAGFLHRDIKPGNIYLRDEGEPLLIDFGAARQAIGEHSRSVTGIVSAGYAPTEQYGTDSKKQGPWTDLYALGATMYCCIAGKDPVDAPTRKDALFEGDDDPMPPAQEVGEGRYEASLLSLVDDLLKVSIKDRSQNAHSVLQVFQAGLGPSPVPTEGPAGAEDGAVSAASRTRTVTNEEREAALRQQAAQASADEAEDDRPTQAAGGARLGWMLGALAVLALGAGGWWYQAQTNTPANSNSATSAHSAPINGAVATKLPAASQSEPTALTQAELLSGDAILTLSSTPSGASVLLDGVAIGTTPFDSRKVRAGEYELSLTSPYSQTYAERITLGSYQVTSKAVSLTAAEGKLTVLSTPAGASIVLDGEATGRATPTTFTAIKAGKHWVALTLARHEGRSTNTEVLPDKVALVDVT